MTRTIGLIAVLILVFAAVHARSQASRSLERHVSSGRDLPCFEVQSEVDRGAPLRRSLGRRCRTQGTALGVRVAITTGTVHTSATAGGNPRSVTPPSAGRIVAVPEVGGLHHRYDRIAA